LKDEGYTHLTVNHSIEFKHPDTGAHTNNVKGIWRRAKASMNQYCRKKRFYAGYLAKCMFLKSCQLKNVDPLAEFFGLCFVVYDPVDGV
jgi:hypothetical protein